MVFGGVFCTFKQDKPNHSSERFYFALAYKNKGFRMPENRRMGVGFRPPHINMFFFQFHR